MSKTYYDCNATDWVLEGGDKPQVIVKCRVLLGPEAGETKVYYGSLNGGAAEFTITALKTMGWTGNNLETELDADHGMGTVRFVAVEDDNEYNGKVTRRIKYINAYKQRKMEAREAPAKGFGTRFKALAQSIKVDLDPEAKNIPAVEQKTDENPFG